MNSMQRGAIILTGGQSSRMGFDKALLPFGEVTMLERIMETVRSAVAAENIVVVAAVGQHLPALQELVIRDVAEFQGPLAAIAAGLEALASRTDAMFATGCDTPLISASVISFLFDRLANFDCAVPCDGERLYPLCAIYRTSVLSKLRAFGGRSLHQFISTLNSRKIPCDELRAVDRELNSLHNINTHTDYVAALAAAGLSTP